MTDRPEKCVSGLVHSYASTPQGCIFCIQCGHILKAASDY